MKRGIALVLGIAAGLNVAAAAAPELRIGVYENEPKIFTDAKGKPAGIFIDLIEAVAAREGWRLRYVPCRWQDCLSALRRGELDLLPDVAYSESRALGLDFHHQVALHSWSQIYARPESKLISIFQLQDERVAVLEGSVQHDTFKQLAAGFGVELELVPVASLEQAFALTARGAADAAISNHRYGLLHGARYGLEPTPIVFSPVKLYFAAAAGRQDQVLAALDRQLQAWRRDENSPYYAILRRWQTPLSGPAVPVAVWWSLGAALGVLALVLGAFSWRRRRANQAAIQRLAYYDTLTGLPNRAFLLERLRRSRVSAPALIHIDLDRFKDLNDALGHTAGDALLCEVAERLRSLVDTAGLVARLGADEFAVLLEDAGADPAAAEQLAGRILAGLNGVYRLGEERHHCSSSIGVGLAEAGAAGEVLFKHAEMAMYAAKEAGRNTLRVFSPAMEAIVTQRLAVETDLREGLREEQFYLVYQPQVDGAGRVIGAEALLRWSHPRRGEVPPGEFIPIAEACGLVLPLGRWVLASACRQLARWAREPATAHLSLAVNVSARQFHAADFSTELLDLLRESGVPAQRLKLELTETILLEDLEEAAATMAAIASLGVRLSLDDFGTGYSSLAYLKRLPLSQLKIDQSFVRDVLDDPVAAAIARSIVGLGESLELEVIAEGVETPAQRKFLEQIGCRVYQGYLFGRPGPAAALERLLEAAAHESP